MWPKSWSCPLKKKGGGSLQLSIYKCKLKKTVWFKKKCRDVPSPFKYRCFVSEKWVIHLSWLNFFFLSYPFRCQKNTQLSKSQCFRIHPMETHINYPEYFSLCIILHVCNTKKNHFSKAIISETLQRIKSYVKRTTSTKHRGNEGMRHRKKWRRIIWHVVILQEEIHSRNTGKLIYYYGKIFYTVLIWITGSESS